MLTNRCPKKTQTLLHKIHYFPLKILLYVPQSTTLQHSLSLLFDLSSYNPVKPFKLHQFSLYSFTISFSCIILNFVPPLYLTHIWLQLVPSTFTFSFKSLCIFAMVWVTNYKITMDNFVEVFCYKPLIVCKNALLPWNFFILYYITSSMPFINFVNSKLR